MSNLRRLELSAADEEKIPLGLRTVFYKDLRDDEVTLEGHYLAKLATTTFDFAKTDRPISKI